MKNLCVIPARKNSVRIPDKNIKDFMGQPIIAYSIQAAQESGLFDRIVVSTDGIEIAQVAAKYGAEICIRPDALAVNEVGTFEVVRHAARCYLNDGYDNVLCLYATSPMISVKDILIASGMLSTIKADHVVSVGYPNLRDAAQIYFSTINSIAENIGYFDLDSTTVCYKIAENRICDINTMPDWARAEEMYKKLKGAE